jgi:antitoxin VapB
MTQRRRVRLFRIGRGQAVRIPVALQLPGDEAIMHRDGERLVIEPVRKRRLIALLETMTPMEKFLKSTIPYRRRNRCKISKPNHGWIKSA